MLEKDLLELKAQTNTVLSNAERQIAFALDNEQLRAQAKVRDEIASREKTIIFWEEQRAELLAVINKTFDVLIKGEKNIILIEEIYFDSISPKEEPPL